MMSRLVPKLRFDGFFGEWEEKELEKIYNFFTTNSFPRDKLNYENGIVKNIHYGDIHTKFSTLFDIKKERVPYINQSVNIERIKKENYCLEGDMIFADASEDLDDIGKSMEIINLNNEILLSGLHTLLARQKEKKLIKGFSGYLFKSNYIRNQIKREAQGTKVLGISIKRLKEITILYPKSKPEQQKIANCLSSLDNLIEAENKKVEALKKYKRGLMQRLFPKDGERVPEFRFDGFFGEWEEKTLEGLSDFINEKILLSQINLDNYISTENLLADFGGITKSSKLPNVLNVTKFKEDDVLMSNIRPYLKKIWLANIEGGVSNDIIVIRVKEDNNYQFLLYIVENDKFIDFVMQGAKGVKMPRGDISLIKKYLLFIPKPKEQQKIANCLISLDNLIESQNKKIEALKKHKKGLMQRLFVGA